MKFLVEDVWRITNPISVIDYWCGDGYLGKKLLEVLPKGSSYTGIDSAYFIDKAKETFMDTKISTDFIESSIYDFATKKKYDLAICQACFYHIE